ncbi:MAG: maleylpyruvate isomerase N-terminal domain-containing protein [bacterium]
MSDDDVRVLGDERRRLMNELELERNQLIRNIETCRIRDIERPFIAEWSLKDIVGHVASREAEYVTALRDLRAGQRVNLDELDAEHQDKWNADHVERKRDLNFWSVFEQLRGGRARLLEELAHISDEDLLADDSPSGRIVRVVLDHDREHWHRMAAVLAGLENERKSRAQAAGSAT